MNTVVRLFHRNDDSVEIHGEVSMRDGGDIEMSGYEVDKESPAETEEWSVLVPAQAVPHLIDALAEVTKGADTVVAAADLIRSQQTGAWPGPSDFFMWLEERRIPYRYRKETPTGNDVAVDFDGTTVSSRRAGPRVRGRPGREVIKERHPPHGPR